MTEKRKRILAKTNGRCGYCGISLEGIKWHADHIEPVYRESVRRNGRYVPTGNMERPENDTEDNLMAACPSCNIAKSVGTVEDFRDRIMDMHNQLERISNYRILKRYGKIVENHDEVIFYFETLKDSK